MTGYGVIKPDFDRCSLLDPLFPRLARREVAEVGRLDGEAGRPVPVVTSNLSKRI